VKTLRLQNFRCFGDVTLGPFDPHFNLLVGENGAGKSSVLVALASLYRQIVAGYPINLHEIISHSDFNTHSSRSENHYRTLELSSTFIDHRLTGSTSIEAIAERADHDSMKPINFKEQYEALRAAAGDILLISYDVRRLFGQGEYRYSYDVDTFADVHPAFEGWLDPGVDSSSLRSWMRDQTLLALQAADRANKGIKPTGKNLRILQLGIVNGAVVSAIEGAAAAEYDAERQDIAISYNDGSVQYFRQMSAGQRAFVGLFADIARRACLLNAERFGTETLTGTRGLVLIDEIDLHLHPKWQRQIISALTGIFPKIQFFATTHSPQVIGEAKTNEIVLLGKGGQQKRPSGSYGRESNWILECVMEAEGRDPEVAKQLKKLWKTIEDGHLDKARAQIKKLRGAIGDDPDIIGAEAYMWRIENLGEEAAE